jgi:hypothetical protein
MIPPKVNSTATNTKNDEMDETAKNSKEQLLE